jgi:hypothetical protein
MCKVLLIVTGSERIIQDWTELARQHSQGTMKTDRLLHFIFKSADSDLVLKTFPTAMSLSFFSHKLVELADANVIVDEMNKQPNVRISLCIQYSSVVVARTFADLMGPEVYDCFARFQMVLAGRLTDGLQRYVRPLVMWYRRNREAMGALVLDLLSSDRENRECASWFKFMDMFVTSDNLVEASSLTRDHPLCKKMDFYTAWKTLHSAVALVDLAQPKRQRCEVSN